MSTSPLPTGLKFELVPSSIFSSEPSADVVAINVTHLLEVVVPGYWSMSLADRPDYEETQALIWDWCDANGAHHYWAPREDFSIYEAAREAVEKGLLRVVYEDLS